MTPIIYLHGFASSPMSRKARFFRDYLRQAGLNILAPDLAADDGFERLTISGQLAVLERAADGGAVSLIGSSMGGYIAALYAARHPEVGRLALLAPAFGFARRWTEALEPARLEEWRRTGATTVFHYGEGRDCSLGYQLIEDALRYEEYPAFTQPTLIFHGLRDEVVPPSTSQHVAAVHPTVQLELLNSGHDLLEALDYIAPKVAAFLKASRG